MNEKELEFYRQKLPQNHFVQLKSVNDSVLSLESNKYPLFLSFQNKIKNVAERYQPPSFWDIFEKLFFKSFKNQLLEIENDIFKINPIFYGKTNQALEPKQIKPKNHFSIFFFYESEDLPALKRIFKEFILFSYKALPLAASKDESVLANHIKKEGYYKVFLFLSINKSCDKNEWASRMVFLNELASTNLFSLKKC